MKKLKLWHYGLMVIVVGLLGNVLLNLFAVEVSGALGMTGLQMLSFVCNLIVAGGIAMVGLHLRVKHPILCIAILGFAVFIGGDALMNIGVFIAGLF